MGYEMNRRPPTPGCAAVQYKQEMYTKYCLVLKIAQISLNRKVSIDWVTS